jgi:hypothetical protein
MVCAQKVDSTRVRQRAGERQTYISARGWMEKVPRSQPRCRSGYVCAIVTRKPGTHKYTFGELLREARKELDEQYERMKRTGKDDSVFQNT